MRRPSLDDLRQLKESQEGKRRRPSAKTAFRRRVEEAWNSAAPSRHSYFDNLIPTWQRALLRFAAALEHGEEEVDEDT